MQRPRREGQTRPDIHEQMMSSPDSSCCAHTGGGGGGHRDRHTGTLDSVRPESDLSYPGV